MTSRRPARVLAILSGGLALGVAGSMTAAAWQDPETATSTFAAATFETQSQGDGGDWAHHAPGSAASLSADLTGLTPGGTYEAPTAGDSAYGGMNVRTAAGSTRGGEVQLLEVTGDGALAGALEYRVVVREASTAPCSATDFTADALYLAGSADSYVPVGTPVGAASTEIGADAEDPIGLCLDLRVAAPAEGDTGADLQGTSSQVDLSVTVTQH